MQTAQLLKEARETLVEAKKDRDAALEQVKALADKLQTRSWNEEKDGAKLESAQADLARAEEAVATQEKESLRYEGLLDIERRAAGWTTSATEAPKQTENRASTGPTVTILPEGSRGDKYSQVRKEYRILKAVQDLVQRNGLTGLELEMYQEAQIENRNLGLSTSGNLLIPFALRSPEIQKRDMLAGTTTAGGFTIQTDVGNLIPILEPRLVTERLGATVLRGLTGNIDFPRNDADAAAVWASEVATATETSPTFDRLQMSPNRLAAFTDISKQVMVQSTIDMENFVRGRLNFAIAQALDTAALTGGGGSEPTGIDATSGINTVTCSSALPTWAKIIEFETNTATSNADYGNLAYLVHPTIAGGLKSKEKATNTGQFVWMGANNGEGQLNGYRAVTSTLCPGAGINYTGFFGNWSELIIGQWGGLDIMVNPYTKAKEATVEIVVNSFWDCGVRHAASFCVATDMGPS